MTAVLHALYDNTRVHEENAPLVITEDNQPSDRQGGHSHTDHHFNQYRD